jgi:hypothetical protein
MANTKQSRAAKPLTSNTPPDTFLEDTAATEFPGRKIDITKIDRAWEQQRAAMTRIALLVLRDNDRQLAEKFSQSDRAALTAMSMVNQLDEEVEFLKKGIEILEAASARLMIVAARRELSNVRAKAVPNGY